MADEVPEEPAAAEDLLAKKSISDDPLRNTGRNDDAVKFDLTPNYNWVNVTEPFFKATEELKLGELLHDDMFGLFEAMSAIEMMDPKMDAGMMNNRKKKVLNFDQALKANKLKIQDFSVEELIGVIDATFACLVTWLEGHSLAQTVLTNLYLHKPFAIEDRVIKAFSIGMLKLIDVISEHVTKAAVFEEEDFQPVVYGFQTANDVTEVKAAGMMKEVEEEFLRKVKMTRNKPGEEQDSQTLLEHEDSVALYSRIRFCRLLYQALLVFGKKRVGTAEEVDKYLVQCLELLPAIEKSIDRGIQPEAPADLASKADYPTIMGFEPLVNQRLLPPTFPRYTKIKSRPEAIQYLEGLVSRIRTVCRVTECTNFHVALDYFIEFSKIPPCVLSRSLLQILYLPMPNKVLGSQSLVDLLKDIIRAFIKPPILTTKWNVPNSIQAKEYVDRFLNHCSQTFSNLLLIYGHNRARQRDKLAHLLEELSALQDEADKVDSYLNELSMKSDNGWSHLACFGTWVLYHTLRVMIQYVLSGFELELYSVHEYTYVFWYLHEFLYGWIISSLSRADTFLMEYETQADQLPKSRNAKKNKKKKKSRPHGREILLNQAMQNLCGGYYKAVLGFNLDNKLKLPCPEFDNEQVRYEHRFSPFNSVITPPPVQYAQYKEMTDIKRYVSQPVTDNFYMNSCKCFQQARTLFENLCDPTEEILTLIKISKMNFVVMKLLLSGHKKSSTVPPEFDFSLHRVFPVIRLP